MIPLKEVILKLKQELYGLKSKGLYTGKIKSLERMIFLFLKELITMEINRKDFLLNRGMEKSHLLQQVNDLHNLFNPKNTNLLKNLMEPQSTKLDIDLMYPINGLRVKLTISLKSDPVLIINFPVMQE